MVKNIITSKETSISTLNKIYKDIANKYVSGTTILDWGCGKYNVNSSYAENCGYDWYGYDPYNRTMEDNVFALDRFDVDYPDIIICSNVLNVINDNRILNQLVSDISSFSNKDTYIYFTVYEGDKSGAGKITSKGYQRNQKAAAYVSLISTYFNIISRKGNIFKCSLKKGDIE